MFVLVGVRVGVAVTDGVGVSEGIVEQSVNAVTSPTVLISTAQTVDDLCNLQYLFCPLNKLERGTSVVYNFMPTNGIVFPGVAYKLALGKLLNLQASVALL